MMGDLDREKLRQQLYKHEALKLKPYVDTAGKVTIGVGRNLDDVGISATEADMLLSNDIARVVRGLVNRYPTWFPELDPVRQAVLVNMAFNLGLSGLAGFTDTLSFVAKGKYTDASLAMLKSKWVEQVGSRAIELAKQMESGEWAA